MNLVPAFHTKHRCTFFRPQVNDAHLINKPRHYPLHLSATLGDQPERYKYSLNVFNT